MIIKTQNEKEHDDVFAEAENRRPITESDSNEPSEIGDASNTADDSAIKGTLQDLKDEVAQE